MSRYVRERGYKGGGRDPLLTIGKTYVVLGTLSRPAPYTAQVRPSVMPATNVI
ncbi:hypothetical protein LMG28138_03254 [Pararobbsia alpina]|uniref:Uncharacterized protein n=1 Tax=Pararobbsia alpina TaxID=621374 RepID=A0A6S7BAZ1_9BURK|nr:hypothetical protein LMG28138_03254 [Pararobbsia alpina]